jgi:hypothetical protein
MVKQLSDLKMTCALKSPWPGSRLKHLQDTIIQAFPRLNTWPIKTIVNTLCILMVVKWVALFVSHTLMVVSLDALNSVCPLFVRTMSLTQSVCCDNEPEYGS